LDGTTLPPSAGAADSKRKSSPKPNVKKLNTSLPPPPGPLNRKVHLLPLRRPPGAPPPRPCLKSQSSSKRTNSSSQWKEHAECRGRTIHRAATATATATATTAGKDETTNGETSREVTTESTAKKTIETSRFSVTVNPGFIRRSERRDRISRSERFGIRGRHQFPIRTPVKQPQPDQLTAHATWSSSGVESRRSRSMRRTCSSSRSRPKSKQQEQTASSSPQIPTHNILFLASTIMAAHIALPY